MGEIPYLDGASSSSDTGKATATPTKDEAFFIESIFIVFEVENRLFRVPSYMFFKESPTFVETFDLPPLFTENHGDGTNPENPIVLPDDVRCEDFRNLLKALYPRSVSLRLSLSKAEWISILKLSTKWRFLGLRKLAKSELEAGKELSSVEKIILGRDIYDSSWISAGYKELVQKSDTITDDEAIAIELPIAIKLYRIREIKLRQSLTSALRAVEEVFAMELGVILSKEMGYRTDQEEAEALAEMKRQLGIEEQQRLLEEKSAIERGEPTTTANEEKSCEIEVEEKAGIEPPSMGRLFGGEMTNEQSTLGWGMLFQPTSATTKKKKPNKYR
ncbi:hypothetical protein M413DRAFT_32563 [Hebeloma cylindrosporum]|uniref:BTB domain-containing protein n=1 Tax=Hebeloma cylindrosporum TaxID=76867 RepID=A0A0C2XBH7_HEBCY|nr:hypothetical protein M413DRAFT_32563 [Hebeloma cylindrosporum h7]